MKPEATLYSFRFVFLERSGTPEAQRKEQERIPMGSLSQLTPRTPVRVNTDGNHLWVHAER